MHMNARFVGSGAVSMPDHRQTAFRQCRQITMFADVTSAALRAKF